MRGRLSRRFSLIAINLALLFVAPLCGQTKALVISKVAEVHIKPSGKSSVISRFEAGSEIDIESRFLGDEWAMVSIGGEKGWIDREDIRVLMDDPWENAAWIYMGRSPLINGFTVRFYLNATQVVRKGDRIRFWTKMIPKGKPAYFDFIMRDKPSRDPSAFLYNTDLWEGDCASDKVSLRRTILFWQDNGITRPNIARKKVDVTSGSAAKAMLAEACNVSKR